MKSDRPHVLVRHTNCEREYCSICDGGLSLCEVCGGAEGSMPTECPGERMSGDQIDAVYAGNLDFVDNEWKEQSAWPSRSP